MTSGSNRFLTDKSLLMEGRLAGWFRDAPMPFAEPGVKPHYSPDRAFELLRLAVELWIDPEDPAIRGEARIDVGPTPAGLGEVVLDLADMTVTDVSAGDQVVRWRHVDGKLRISGLKDAATLAVRWEGKPRLGLYFVGPDAAHPDRKHEAWSQCQDEDAHFFFPCFDHPSVKQPVAMTVNAPSKYTVVANGQLQSKSEEGGWTRWAWAEERPIPVYIVTVVVAELQVFETSAGELPVRYLVPPGVDAATVERTFGDTPAMITYLEGLLGTPFPYPRYDQVVVHDFIFGGMENAAATTMTDLLLVDEKAVGDWEPQHLVVHELAHQWFGDLVTCQDWSQGWLNEGWATYSETLWAEVHNGEAYATWYMWQTAQDYFSEADGRYNRPLVTYDFRAPIDVFDRHLYEKGGCVIHTLRHELGEEAFWTGVRHYLALRADQTAHTRHFQSALEESTGRNLDAFFQQWVYGVGFPELSVKLSHSDGLLSVSVDQKQSGEGVVEAFRFGLRIVAVGADGAEQVIDLPVSERSRAFTIPAAEAPSFVRVDPGFRVLSRVALEAPRSWLSAMLTGDACPVGRIRAARALVKQGTPRSIAAVLVALPDEREDFVRAAWIQALSARRDAAVRDALLAALDTEVRSRPRQALVSALGGWREDTDVQVRLAAIVGGDEASWYVEGAAARTLGEMRSPLAREACEALLERDSWGDSLRTRALAGLGATRDPSVLPLLLRWTRDDVRPRARAAAAGALGRLADEVESVRREAVDRLLELAESGSFRVILAAISALGRVRDPRSAGTLGRLHASAGDGRVARMAYEALRRVRAGRSGDAALASLRGTVETLEREQGRLRDRLAKLERI